MPPNTFDQYASDYDATVQAAIGASGESVAFFAELKAKLARELAPSNTSRVLDFGCGVGNLARALASRFPNAKIVGTDPSPESLAAACEKAAGIEFVRQLESRLPFDDAAFDLAAAACVFHHVHIAERSLWMRELARVLRPGGRLVLFEHNPLNPLTRRVVKNVPFDADAVLLRRREAADLMRRAGLRVRTAKYYFFFPRFLSALRPMEPLMGWLPLGGQYYVLGER